MAKLVELGEEVELQTRQRVRDRMEQRKHQVRKMAGKREKAAADAEAEMEAQVRGFLDRMNVPTKDDIDALGAQVTELTKKVDELKKT
jgi:poly(hydroxyalkanoate) granule-associated protein